MAVMGYEGVEVKKLLRGGEVIRLPVFRQWCIGDMLSQGTFLGVTPCLLPMEAAREQPRRRS